MTGPGPSNCSERVLKVRNFYQEKYDYDYEKKYALCIFFVIIMFFLFQAQSLPTIGHLHPEFCKVGFSPNSPWNSMYNVHSLLLENSRCYLYSHLVEVVEVSIGQVCHILVTK